MEEVSFVLRCDESTNLSRCSFYFAIFALERCCSVLGVYVLNRKQSRLFMCSASCLNPYLWTPFPRFATQSPGLWMAAQFVWTPFSRRTAILCYRDPSQVHIHPFTRPLLTTDSLRSGIYSATWRDASPHIRFPLINMMYWLDRISASL